jgi:ketosteroid isomerase-like protein
LSTIFFSIYHFFRISLDASLHHKKYMMSTGKKNAENNTTDRESNVNVIREFYNALAGGDVPTIVEVLDPKVEWRVPESVPWGGTFHCHDGFREFIRKLFDQPVELNREVLQYLDAGEQVVVRLRQMGKRKGGRTGYDVAEAQVWTVRNGKVVDFEGYFDTAIVLDTLQLQPRVIRERK